MTISLILRSTPAPDVNVYVRTDDRNQPDDSTRWRMQAVLIDNNSPYTYRVRAYDSLSNIDPNTNDFSVYYDVIAAPRTANEVQLPNSVQTRDANEFHISALALDAP